MWLAGGVQRGRVAVRAGVLRGEPVPARRAAARVCRRARRPAPSAGARLPRHAAHAGIGSSAYCYQRISY